MADALSRVMNMQVVSVISKAGWKSIEEETTLDPQLKTIMHELVHDPKSKPAYELKRGLLWYRGTLVLPLKS